MDCVQWETLRIGVDGLTSSQLSETARSEEVVGQCDAAATRHGKDFVLAIAVEGCPVDLGCGVGSTAPVEANIVAFVAHGEFTICVFVSFIRKGCLYRVP